MFYSGFCVVFFFVRILLTTKKRCLLPKIDLSLEQDGSGCCFPLGFRETITEFRAP